jgi:hypothetical protein
MRWVVIEVVLCFCFVHLVVFFEINGIILKIGKKRAGDHGTNLIIPW